jgi:hypothetical protein
MSAASTPAPSGRPSTPRVTFFVPNLILMVAFGWLVGYQVVLLEDTLDQTTKAVDKLDAQVKTAKHHKAMFYGLARDLLAISDSDPNAEAIAKEYKLHEMKANNSAPFTVQMDDDIVAAAATNAPAANPPAPK